MSKAAAWEDDFYIERTGDGRTYLRADGIPTTGKRCFGGTRTPFAAWAEAWGAEADEYATRRGGSRAEALKKACAWHIQDARQRLTGRTLDRWDLPDGSWHPEALLDRIWRLEAEAEDAAEFFELYASADAPEAPPRQVDANGNLPPPAPRLPERVAYEAALKERAVYASGSAFPKRENWPEDDVKAYAEALSLARRTLAALKERHRRGADPKAPLTIEGRNLVCDSIKARPRLTADELRAGLAAFAPQTDAAQSAAKDGGKP